MSRIIAFRAKVSEQVKKETEKLNSVLKLAYGKITMLEVQVKQANIDIEAEEQKNNVLNSQNKVLIDKVNVLEQQANKNKPIKTVI